MVAIRARRPRRTSTTPQRRRTHHLVGAQAAGAAGRQGRAPRRREPGPGATREHAPRPGLGDGPPRRRVRRHRVAIGPPTARPPTAGGAARVVRSPPDPVPSSWPSSPWRSSPGKRAARHRPPAVAHVRRRSLVRPSATARPSSTTRPSRMRTMRSAAAATSASWVTMQDRLAAAGAGAGTARAPRRRPRSRGRRWARRPAAGRLVGQGPGDGQALPLAAGQRAGAWRALSPMPSRSSRSRARASAGSPLGAGDERRHDHVLQHGHALEQVEELEHDADVAPPHAGQAASSSPTIDCAGHGDVALVGPVEPGHDVEQRRLPASRRAHDGHELARLDLEVGSPQGPYRSRLPLEGRNTPRTSTASGRTSGLARMPSGPAPRWSSAASRARGDSFRPPTRPAAGGRALVSR